MTEYDLDLPQERARCVEEVGMTRYCELLRLHHERQVVSTVGGHQIRRIKTARFGDVFKVGDTDQAFSTQALAEGHAERNAI